MESGTKSNPHGIAESSARDSSLDHEEQKAAIMSLEDITVLSLTKSEDYERFVV